MNDSTEKREFTRYPVDLELAVSGSSKAGEAFRENPLIHDISGEGVSFLSEDTANFYLGQSLHIVVSLPGTDNVKAVLKSSGKVVRIAPAEVAGTQNKRDVTRIAVRLVAPLGFERIDDHG